MNETAHVKLHVESWFTAELQPPHSGAQSYRGIRATRRICHNTCDFLAQTCTAEECELCRWNTKEFFIFGGAKPNVFSHETLRDFSRSIINCSWKRRRRGSNSIPTEIDHVNESCNGSRSRIRNRDVMTDEFERKNIDLLLLDDVKK